MISPKINIKRFMVKCSRFQAHIPIPNTSILVKTERGYCGFRISHPSRYRGAMYYNSFQYFLPFAFLLYPLSFELCPLSLTLLFPGSSFLLKSQISLLISQYLPRPALSIYHPARHRGATIVYPFVITFYFCLFPFSSFLCE